MKKIQYEMAVNHFGAALALLQRVLDEAMIIVGQWLLYSIIIWIEIYETLL